MTPAPPLLDVRALLDELQAAYDDYYRTGSFQRLLNVEAMLRKIEYPLKEHKQ